jgi:nucleoside-diphosphate-sugar epimerase
MPVPNCGRKGNRYYASSVIIGQNDTTKVNQDSKINVLVTGATGFLGRRLTRALIENGFSVNAFVRKHSRTDRLKAIGARLCYGDIGDAESLTEALKGVDVVVHAAADTTGNARAGRRITILGTRNVIAAAQAQAVKQLIYISSCNVYAVARCRSGSRLDESAPLERRPEKRGSYTYAKFMAEQAVREAMQTGRLNITCLRPGTIWGPGGAIYTPMMGFNAGSKVYGIIGNGRFILPLVYIDNLVGAIIGSIGNEGAFNQVYNVVDDPSVTKKQYVDAVLKPLYPRAFVFYIPYGLLYAVVWCQERLFRLVKRSPFLSCYRLTSSQRHIVYDAGKLRRETGWSTAVSFDQAAGEVIAHERSASTNRSGSHKP